MFSSAKFFTNLFIMFLIHSLPAGSYSTTFTIVNRCSITVSPGIYQGAGTPLLYTTGFSLHPDESKVLIMPLSWSGRLWGRTHCSYDSNGNFSCLTGDCASSTIECDGGNSATPPATLAEFNLNPRSSGFDFFRVSVVNGYNLPMMVAPLVGNDVGDCMTTSCMVHLNKMCPSELKLMSAGGCIGCRSAFQPFSKYSESFKKACPHANVDATKTFQGVCSSTDYLITFCPSSTSRMEPSKEKNPTTVDNIVKIILALLGCVATGGTLYFAISCYISYSTNHGWNWNFGLRTRIDPPTQFIV